MTTPARHSPHKFPGTGVEPSERHRQNWLEWERERLRVKDLADVRGEPSDGDTLIYHSDTKTWEPGAVGGGGGFPSTPVGYAGYRLTSLVSEAYVDSGNLWFPTSSSSGGGAYVKWILDTSVPSSNPPMTIYPGSGSIQPYLDAGTGNLLQIDLAWGLIARGRGPSTDRLDSAWVYTAFPRYPGTTSSTVHRATWSGQARAVPGGGNPQVLAGNLSWMGRWVMSVPFNMLIHAQGIGDWATYDLSFKVIRWE